MRFVTVVFMLIPSTWPAVNTQDTQDMVIAVRLSSSPVSRGSQDNENSHLSSGFTERDPGWDGGEIKSMGEVGTKELWDKGFKIGRKENVAS